MTDQKILRGGFDPLSLTPRTTTIYPAPYDVQLKGRAKRALGNAAGLRNFGVNLVHLDPGAWSSHRHWHTKQDEFIYVLEGELTLIDDDGEHVLSPGMAAGFPAGVDNGHHVVNKSVAVAVYLEVGDRTLNDAARYPDVDMRAEPGDGGRGFRILHKDGTPFPEK